MRILGGDTVAGDALGVRASGLAERRYGMYFVAGSTSPLRYLAARRNSNLGLEPESVVAAFNPKIRAPIKFK